MKASSNEQEEWFQWAKKQKQKVNLSVKTYQPTYFSAIQFIKKKDICTLQVDADCSWWRHIFYETVQTSLGL